MMAIRRVIVNFAIAFAILVPTNSLAVESQLLTPLRRCDSGVAH